MSRHQSSTVAATARLRGRREALGLTQAKVAARLGVDRARYSHWEKVFGPLPQLQYGDALARILAVETEWLCSGIGDAQPSSPPSLTSSTTTNYEALGQRAATRRRALKLSRAKVAEAVGVSNFAIVRWENSMPRQYRGKRELAWEDILQVPQGWLREPEMAPDASSTSPYTSIDLTSAAPISVAAEIRAVGAWLARAGARSRTARFEELSDAEQRRATMFADRYGVRGAENAILQVIGNRFQLTRERVRQVVDVLTDRARGVTVALPRLMQLKEEVAAAPPMTVAEFEAEHRELLGEDLALADADRFAREIMGFGLTSITERSLWQAGNALQPMVGGTDGRRLAVAVRDASRKMIRRCGAANAMFVTGMVSAALGEAVSILGVRLALSGIEGMEWLVEDEDWFWLGSDAPRNRILDVVRKVLAVAGRRLDVEDLHQAVCRSRRLIYEEDRTSPPSAEVPEHVLREMLTRVPWLSVAQRNNFMLTESIPLNEVLSSSELAVADMMRRHGGAVARRSLYKEFVVKKVFSLMNLQIVLASSPIIRPLGYGVYGLQGVQISGKALSTAMAKVGNAIALPPTAGASGWLEFEIKMKDYNLRNGVVDFPAHVVKVIPAGAYQVEGLVDGAVSVRTVPSSPTRVTGLIPLLRKAGVRTSDVLRVRMHPGMLIAQISRARSRS